MKAIAAGMGHHLANPTIQSQGYDALSGIAALKTEKAVIDGGGVVAIVAGMGKHMGDGKVQLLGYCAMATIAAEDCARSVVDSEGAGVGAVTAGMGRRLGGIGARMSCAGENRSWRCVKALVKGGAVDRIVAGMGKHLDYCGGARTRRACASGGVDRP